MLVGEGRVRGEIEEVGKDRRIGRERDIRGEGEKQIYIYSERECDREGGRARAGYIEIAWSRA